VHLSWLKFVFVFVLYAGISGCQFDPVKTAYTPNSAKILETAKISLDGSILVFRTSGYKIWAKEDAEFVVNEQPAALFKAGGTAYLPLMAGTNTIQVREPGSFITCGLEFEFEPGAGQFVEIYERLEPGALLLSFILADMASRMLFDPHPEGNCNGVFGLSMGQVDKSVRSDSASVYGFQVK
jgi:hypothetical protein